MSTSCLPATRGRPQGQDLCFCTRHHWGIRAVVHYPVQRFELESHWTNVHNMWLLTYRVDTRDSRTMGSRTTMALYNTEIKTMCLDGWNFPWNNVWSNVFAYCSAAQRKTLQVRVRPQGALCPPWRDFWNPQWFHISSAPLCSLFIWFIDIPSLAWQRPVGFVLEPRWEKGGTGTGWFLGSLAPTASFC